MDDLGQVKVRTLLCHRDVSLMIDNWRTLVACSADVFETVVHDDGSLTQEDAMAIEATIPRSRVLWRKEADALMEQRLARHGYARSFRADSVWGLKLLDVALAEEGDCYYVDGDVRFFRSFGGLFCREALEERAVFLRDMVWTAYSVRPWHLLDRRQLELVEGINTGLTLIDRACYDLDFVEWFLKQPDWRTIPAWTEPTCWAALGARAKAHALEPRQFVNLYPGAVMEGETIAAHFLSAYRGSFDNWLRKEPVRGAPTKVRQMLLRRLGPVELGLNQLRRKICNEWERRTRTA